MKILCIEDNEEKYNNIYNQLVKIDKLTDVAWAKTGNEGLNKLESDRYDMIILDMSLPINGFSTRKEMLYGECILDEMKRSRKKEKVLVVTGFDLFEDKTDRLTFAELHNRLRKKYDRNLLGMIYYDQSSIEWSITLQEIIQSL